MKWAAFIMLAFAQTAFAQTTMPGILKDVGIDQKLDAQVPLDLKFKDETGRDVQLGQYFGKKPVILTLVYYNCPMLCTLVLNDLVRAMNVMKSSAGTDFEIVTVSFDPRETPSLAAEKKSRYVAQYKHGANGDGWHFLTGDEDSIKQLAATVGFRYAFDEKSSQYAHAGGIIILTPQGKVSQYFFGIEYSPDEMGRALVNARSGTIAPPAKQVLLYCFSYDPSTGKYSLSVIRAIKVGAAITILGLGIFLTVMLRRDFLKTPEAPT